MFLEQKGCINSETKELTVGKLEKKLMDKEIDIEIFS